MEYVILFSILILLLAALTVSMNMLIRQFVDRYPDLFR